MPAPAPATTFRVAKGGFIEPSAAAAAPTRAAKGDRTQAAMPSRRELFALAAALAATVVTGAAAIAGLTRKAVPAQPSAPTVSQIVGQAPASPPRVEPGG
jgi:hypothetical protein